MDGFAAGAILLGSWPLMVTAASISALVMVGSGFEVGSREDSSGLEILAHVALAGSSVASAVTTAKITWHEVRDQWWTYTNRTGISVKLVDRRGVEVAVLAPAAKVRLPYNVACYLESHTYHGGGNAVPVVIVFLNRYLTRLNLNADGSVVDAGRAYLAYQRELEQVYLKEPLEVKYFPTVPVGGNHEYTRAQEA